MTFESGEPIYLQPDGRPSFHRARFSGYFRKRTDTRSILLTVLFELQCHFKKVVSMKMSTNSIKLPFTIAYCAILFCFMDGCTNKSQLEIVPVEGMVTLNSKPASNAIITFEDTEKGFAASAVIAADGKYQLQSQYGRGVPPGEYLVSISLPSTRDEFDKQIPLPPGTEKIPEKYHVSQTSNLKAIVKQDAERTFNFDLN